MNSYQELQVWQKSIGMVEEIYRVTKSYPKDELYGIISQTRRAAVSIPANIAEGYARKHRQEYIQFLRIAFGSGAELETHLIIAKRLQLAPILQVEKSQKMLDEIMRMLNGLINSLVAKP